MSTAYVRWPDKWASGVCGWSAAGAAGAAAGGGAGVRMWAREQRDVSRRATLLVLLPVGQQPGSQELPEAALTEALPGSSVQCMRACRGTTRRVWRMCGRSGGSERLRGSLVARGSETCCTPSANEHPPKADTDDKIHVPTLSLQSKHVLPAAPERPSPCIG
eukprot:5711146-Prymnesium_polylepis.2